MQELCQTLVGPANLGLTSLRGYAEFLVEIHHYFSVFSAVFVIDYSALQDYIIGEGFMKSFLISVGLLILVAAGCTLQAASPAIGVAMANGTFLLDRATVVGNANVFDGSTIETQRAMSDINLMNGLKMRLGLETRGRVFQDRLILEKGAGQVSGSRFLVEAGRLRIVPLDKYSAARVAWGQQKLVEVASLAGRVRVETATGLTVAYTDSGSALSFSDEAGAAVPTTLCGRTEVKNGQFMLLDVVTKVTVQLKGAALDEYAGKSVSVTGNMADKDVLQVLTVKADACMAKGTLAEGPGKRGAAAKGSAGSAGSAGGGAGAAPTAGAVGAAHGLSTAAIAGIAVGGAAGLGAGLAGATGAFSGKSASH